MKTSPLMSCLAANVKRTLKLAAVPALLTVTPALAQDDAPIAQTSAAGPAAPSTQEGWNTRWALLFSLNNVLVNNQVLGSPVVGSVGGSYFLTPTMAIRAGVNFGRQHNPAQVTKTVNQAGPDNVTTYQVTNPGGFTSAYTTNLRGEFLKRLTTSAVAPYVGVGGQVGWNWTKQQYTDDKSVVDQRIELDNHTSSFAVTGRGLVGAEWRVHPSFAFYADYSLDVQLYSRSRLRNRTTIENTVGGVASTTETRNERDVNTFLNVSTGLSQAASLGLQIFF